MGRHERPDRTSAKPPPSHPITGPVGRAGQPMSPQPFRPLPLAQDHEPIHGLHCP